MKFEILKEEKKPETAQEIEKQEFVSPKSQLEFEILEDELILKLKKDIDQGVAILDLEQDVNGNITALTIKEAKSGKTLFKTDNKTWAGRKAIEKIVGSMGKEKQ